MPGASRGVAGGRSATDIVKDKQADWGICETPSGSTTRLSTLRAAKTCCRFGEVARCSILCNLQSVLIIGSQDT